MSNYDYGNARLRAMKSRLLTPTQLLALTALADISDLMEALRQTAYKSAVEYALARSSGLAAVAEACRWHLQQSVAPIRRFYQGEAAILVDWALRQFDIFNIKTILRGVSRQLPPHTAMAHLLPLGDLQTADLLLLARSVDTMMVVNQLATWWLPLASPLLQLHRDHPERSLFAQELVLDQWFMHAVLSLEAPSLWYHFWQEQVDMTNILAAFRLMGEGWEVALRQQLGQPAAPISELLAQLWLKGGTISFASLTAVIDQPDLAAAVAQLAATPYASLLQAGLEAYLLDSRLSHFEQIWHQHRHQQARQMFNRDPLGIGVVLGYLVLKRAELYNLRLIGQGIWLQWPDSDLRSELYLPLEARQ